jgi:hypothetical protein
MVARNRFDGHGGGRDDLPRHIRERLRHRHPQVRPAPYPTDPPTEAEPPPRRSWVGDAILLALLFLAMAVTNLVVLVLALVILRGPVVAF